MTISKIILPSFILIIIAAALLKSVPVYDCFLKGAKDGLTSAVSILPSLIGLIAATSMLRASGAFDLLCFSLKDVTSKIGFPAEVLPLALIRPVSGSAALAALRDIYDRYGADSYIGRVASVISGSTDTTFYAIAVYFGAVNIKKTRHTLKSALIADLTSFLIAGFVVSLVLS
ncbi:MAG: spore maturation protein [Clostridia bacterium]|nr:spore maturation protein [Clostridia bacterium]